MFIWNFVLGTVMAQAIDWVYGQVVGFLGNFFALMGNRGVELFSMNWVASIVPVDLENLRDHLWKE